MEEGGEVARPLPFAPPTSLQDFAIGRMLGKGSFGQVFVAQHKGNGIFCALKVSPSSAVLKITFLMMKRLIRGRIMQAPLQEARVQCRLDHPSLVRLEAHFMDSKYVYLVTRFMEKGSLSAVPNAKKAALDEPAAKKVVAQVSAGLAYLHSLSIAHLDIKPSHILVDWDDSVKIADFGTAFQLDVGEELDHMAGTELYRAPEKPYGLKADCWSLGISLLQLTIWPMPEEVYGSPADERHRFIPRSASPELRSLLADLLQVEPTSRLAAAAILQHAFLQ